MRPSLYTFFSNGVAWSLRENDLAHSLLCWFHRNSQMCYFSHKVPNLAWPRCLFFARVPRKREIDKTASEITSVGMNKFDVWIWGKILNITFSTMTLNVGTVNMILLMLITVVKVFLTNLVTKPDVGDVVRWISRLTISDRTARTLRFRSPTPIMALDYTAWRGGGGGVPREGLASLLGRGSNGVKMLYATLLRDCGVFIFNLLYYSKNAAPPRAGGLAL